MANIFVSNCDGTIGKNNIAYELVTHFVPEGDRIYQTLTKYDYAHAMFPKRRDYALGNTSKLILPFLIAFDACNQNVEEFSANNLRIMKGSKATLVDVQKNSEAYIVSTSYEHYVRAICRETNFPLENTYCPKINLDEFDLSSKDKNKLKSYAWEIGGMPIINIPPNARKTGDLSKRDQETVRRLDKIFWKEIAGMSLKRIFSDLEISSRLEKAEAVKDIARTFASPLSKVMYIANDTTDTQAVILVKQSGGLTVSFNGDKAAVKNSEVAIQCENTAVIAVLADLFLRFGKSEAVKAAGNWDKDYLWRTSADPGILDRQFATPPETWPKVQVVSEWNMDLIANESEAFRKTIKGEPVNKQ